RELFDDGQELLEQAAARNLFTARGVHAFWPANSIGDDVDLTLMKQEERNSPHSIFCGNKCTSRRGNSIIAWPTTSRRNQIPQCAIRNRRIISAVSPFQFMARMNSRRSLPLQTMITAQF